ncbi:hypothetical protein [Chryseobacterium sp. CH21]|uniref:hypothetical protein n=1 Tax=Chryseobacterium sp. CH21 TaxID=713556 RepID=UPI00100AA824|nr:hypothetical protein [Chryseobacterium sp. CH21]
MIEQLNAVSVNQVSITYLLQCICSYEGIRCELIDAPPLRETMTKTEKQYYDVIAPVLSHYLMIPHHQFDTTTLKEIMADVPEIDVERRFKDLYSFAYENEFRSL